MSHADGLRVEADHPTPVLPLDREREVRARARRLRRIVEGAAEERERSRLARIVRDELAAGAVAGESDHGHRDEISAEDVRRRVEDERPPRRRVRRPSGLVMALLLALAGAGFSFVLPPVGVSMILLAVLLAGLSLVAGAATFVKGRVERRVVGDGDDGPSSADDQDG